ncbi:hypothetical protein EVAR_98649_1 [Eumeta japonica]|uniref:Uncharacterized protein n=1 Tax=Eumeta variegata TaxID=151549 RepID=A0A4C1XZI8_EUMVA|nr:hypothetical protein EVAR_98649_1 [Eumeta japonica]
MTPVSWRNLPAYHSLARAVDAGKTKAAAPATAKNVSDKADVTAPPSRNHHPCSYRTRIGGPSCAKMCREKIQFSQARNSAQGLKLQAKTVADFKICKIC